MEIWNTNNQGKNIIDFKKKIGPNESQKHTKLLLF